MLPMDQDMRPAYHAKGAAGGYAKDVLAPNRVLEMLKTLKDQLTLDRKGFRSKLLNLFRSHFRIKFLIRLMFRHPESRWL
ncbi:hypothetical protein HAX54_033496 [Datura stramonium]|uniref:Uncharacterized protein n=1 Tax=Datura stramonium TaxID=4076 RepID=A0ABS8VFH1_DATST|nr:hypothetical protein [Datura stramonium]